MGNPLESEQAAFRWLVAVIVGTGLVIAIALLISKPVALLIGLALVGFVAFLAIKGIAGMLRPPEEEQKDIEADRSRQDGSD
jgi:hypothetical protein